MLLSANHLLDFDVEAIDGNIGTVDDFYFDGKQWLVRYVVVDTGRIFPGKKVLLSPHSFGHCLPQQKIMPVNMERKTVKESPDSSSELPVSKLHEIEIHKYYNWAPYWDNDFVTSPSPLMMEPVIDEKQRAEFEEKIKNVTLRSIKEIKGYHIKANDGQIGSIQDFILEDDNWTIRYIVVDAGTFLHGRKVLLSLEWVGDIDWASGTVKVDMSVEQIKNSPEFNPSAPVNREYEIQLFDYYGRPKYWR